MLRRADRAELLRACDRVAPEGPILLSIFEPSVKASNERGLLHCHGAASWRGPRSEELDQHAKDLNRRLVVSLQSPSSYATLIPRV